jgi:hypothetical protein
MLFNYRAVYWPNWRPAHLCVHLYENLFLTSKNRSHPRHFYQPSPKTKKSSYNSLSKPIITTTIRAPKVTTLFALVTGPLPCFQFSRILLFTKEFTKVPQSTSIVLSLMWASYQAPFVSVTLRALPSSLLTSVPSRVHHWHTPTTPQTKPDPPLILKWYLISALTKHQPRPPPHFASLKTISFL